MPLDTTPTTPSTLLDAVNTLLTSIRVAAIPSLLQVNLTEDAAAAKQALDDVSREVQMEGWEFNTEREVVIDPTVEGEIILPFNTLKVVTSRYASGTRLRRRGDRLYDPTKRTFNIGGKVEVDLVVALPFEDLTPAAKAYITAVAARRFGIPKMPTGSTFRFTEEMVATARSLLEREDTDTDDMTLAQTSPHFKQMSRR